METTWRGHTLSVTGDWTGRWLYMAPQYELKLDGDVLATGGGPKVNHTLEAKFEEDGTTYVIAADILSVAGVRPACELFIDDDPVASGRVKVANLLNPLLVFFIIAATLTMLYVGPDAIRSLL